MPTSTNTQSFEDDSAANSNSDDGDSTNTEMRAGLESGDILISSPQARVSPETAHSPEPSVVIVDPPSDTEEGPKYNLQELLKLDINDVVVGDEPVYRVGRSKNEMSRLKKIGPFRTKDIIVDHLRKWTCKSCKSC